MQKCEKFRLQILFALSLGFAVLLFTRTSHSLEAGWFSQIANTGDLSKYASYGTTLMLPYNGAFDPSSIGKYLDEAQLCGIKVWVDLRMEALTLSESAFRTIIKAHRNHPALKGWYISDEPELASTTPAKVEKYYSYCKQEDPDHPVAIAHAKSAYPSYVNGYDVLMIDYYPGWTQYLPNEFNWMVRNSYSKWKAGLEFVKQNRKAGFLAVGLGFGAREDGSNWNGVRDLTYAEYRYHTFSAIVQGVDGFLFFEDDWANTRVKPIIARMISQIHAISVEMAKGKTNDPQIKVSHHSKVVYRYGVNGNQNVILAVNIAGYDVSDQGENITNLQFTLPSTIRISQLEVVDESRTLPVTNGTFTDEFNRFEVHVYRFTHSPLVSEQPVSLHTLRIVN